MATGATRPADENASSAVLAKILAMTFLGVSSFVAGSTPVCVFERLGIRRHARGAANTALRLILNFGGGVLLCTTFLHLLPEVREGVERLTDDGTLDSKSPLAGLLAELVMCAGFFFMYSIEELVHGFAGGDCHAHHSHSSSGHSTADRGGGGSSEVTVPQQRRNDAATAAGYPNAAGYDKVDAAGRVANYNSCMSTVELAKKPGPAIKKPVPVEESSSPSESVLRGFLVVGALSIHELFEGLAVGLEKNPTQVWSLTVAVACHKLVIAFYVGLQMLSDRTKPLLAHCSILLFAVTSPIGIGVGTLVSNLEETNTVVLFSVVLQGLATGTLMYVVFFEVLKPSVGNLQIKQRILRLIFIAIGFASMLSIQLLITESE
ncbi:zinc transporter ZIP1-like [Metopolophium dirhodum]|uniref:zinc transporter ZIP1-like n=1 Tax=Metopolophium dirhodum TaxID=44670 RepID=UPI00298F4C5F|nr:zinc transporter ZIP1-like [Metopolophium dirhodum]XP_060878137.1 zinc transporter ZIP1-like [Metopolophium dirhodum]XP_060878138.1 zinc transporter ZIP1-like [Metopolophium dirhodum]